MFYLFSEGLLESAQEATEERNTPIPGCPVITTERASLWRSVKMVPLRTAYCSSHKSECSLAGPTSLNTFFFFFFQRTCAPAACVQRGTEAVA